MENIQPGSIGITAYPLVPGVPKRSIDFTSSLFENESLQSILGGPN